MPGGGLKQRAYSNSGKVVDAPATTMITAEPGGVESLCMATADASCDFKPLQVLRRPVGEYDVLIDMKYCGVCHSDLHFVEGLYPHQLPVILGHEAAGVVEQVSTQRSRVISPFTTPWYSSSMRCSIEPMPFGIAEKFPRPSSF